MGTKRFLYGSSLSAVVFVCIFMFGLIPEARAAANFNGKVVTIVSGMGAGGGTDLFARLLSRHIGRHLPGKPTVVIRNMGGAQGMIAANYVYDGAKPNGLTLFASSGSNLMMNVLRPKGVVHEFGQMHPLYASPMGNIVVFKPGMIQSPKDLMSIKGVKFGHTGATGGAGGWFVWAQQLIGFPVEKWVWGYDGSGPSRQAFLSGEINSNATTSISYHGALKSFIDKGEAVVVFQSGLFDSEGNIVREDSIPKDIPLVTELYEQIHGKKPAGPYYDAYKLLLGQCTYGKCLLLPGKTPPDVLKAWQQAAFDMTKDPEFLKDAERLMPDTPHLTYKELAKNYAAGVSADPALTNFIRKILTEQHGVAFD